MGLRSLALEGFIMIPRFSTKFKSTKVIKNRFILAFLLGILVYAIGTLGYTLIEGWPLFDSLYMTVITLATIGYQEVHALSAKGRIFTILLIILGIGVIAFVLDLSIRMVIEGDLQKILRRHKLEKIIKSLKGHIVVCGYGRMGKVICQELSEKNIPFVVVEKDLNESSKPKGLLLIEGDATNEDILRLTGIEKAHHFIAVLSSDVNNLYAVMSARELNPDINIVARAGEERARKKLKRAGANKVVLPYDIGGFRIVNAVLKPAIVDFVEFAIKGENMDIIMEEIIVHDNASIANKSIKDSQIGSKYRVIIIAIKRKDSQMIFNPMFDTIILPGDTLIVLCEKEKIPDMKSLCLTHTK